MTTMLTHSGTPAEMLADLLKRKKRPKARKIPAEERRLRLVNDQGRVIGQDHHRAKLSDEDCRLICELRAEGLEYAEIAKKFDVSTTLVCYICNGQRRTQVATGQRLR